MIKLTDDEKAAIRYCKEYLQKNDIKTFCQVLRDHFPWNYSGHIFQFMLENKIPLFEYLTEIPEGMFYGAEIDKITIPDNIERIGNFAFQRCGNLKTVDLGNSITAIGKGAFADCPRLTKVLLPDSLKLLGEGVFENCNDNIVLLANSRAGASRLKCKQSDIEWYKKHLYLNDEPSEQEEETEAE